MVYAKQGDLLLLEENRTLALVLSKDLFNASGFAILCPVVKRASKDTLHIAIQTDSVKGIALCEQLRSLDLKKRFYKTAGSLPFEQIQEIADAVQSLFDYYPYGAF